MKSLKMYKLYCELFEVITMDFVPHVDAWFLLELVLNINYFHPHTQTRNAYLIAFDIHILLNAFTLTTPHAATVSDSEALILNNLASYDLIVMFHIYQY